MIEPIFIVSAPRSGSSLLSYILHTEGVQVGETKPADKYNPNGYFENLKIRELVIERLKKQDKRNEGKKFQPVNLTFGSIEIAMFKYGVYASLLDENVDLTKPWLFKDPKIALTWLLFAKSFPDAKWILLYRDNDAIIDSYSRTEFMDAYQTRQDWEQYLTCFEANMESIKSFCANTHTFAIESLFENDTDKINELFSFLGIENTGKYESCIDKRYFGKAK